MNFFTYLALLILPLSVSAQTLLECHPREGKFDVQEIVVGNVVIDTDQVTLFQQTPVFESVTFDVKKAVRETSRTGSWTTYSEEREMDQEIITLQLEDSGKTRRGYLTRESTISAEEPFFSLIPLKCLELK
jgi:hypothetical protein